ncbi:unnamed protein product [Moneuplotes crassus]|uniref:Uncharacterized protein n=1 Tax=Euplotes crassus TaxID=5936 RepID=A0AAD2D775_EUPCR|nr:unnamed protein product [Moneuplotes crassus]
MYELFDSYLTIIRTFIYKLTLCGMGSPDNSMNNLVSICVLQCIYCWFISFRLNRRMSCCNTDFGHCSCLLWGMISFLISLAGKSEVVFKMLVTVNISIH